MAPSDDDLFGAEHLRVYRDTSGERGQVALELLPGRGSAENDIRPRLCTRKRKRESVSGAPRAPGSLGKLATSPRAVKLPLASACLTITPTPAA